MTERGDLGGDLPALPDCGLPRNARQEQISRGAVQLIAAAAGCSIKHHETDYDGVDLTIVASTRYQVVYGPQVEVQLKCTTQHDLLRADHLAWRMERDPLAKLADPRRFAPAILVVMLLPPEPAKWVRLSEKGLVTGGPLYWEQATNLGVAENDAASRTVRLPRRNLFTAEALKGIMKEIGDEGGWR